MPKKTTKKPYSASNREEALQLALHHICRCTTCLDNLYAGFGEPLCKNGERLWKEAKVGPIPEKMPEGCGGCFARGTKTFFKVANTIFPEKDLH